jgi:hypothetical protein
MTKTELTLIKLISEQLRNIRAIKSKPRKRKSLLNLLFYLEGYTDAILREEN